jgi:hypothetical protein
MGIVRLHLWSFRCGSCPHEPCNLAAVRPCGAGFSCCSNEHGVQRDTPRSRMRLKKEISRGSELSCSDCLPNASPPRSRGQRAAARHSVPLRPNLSSENDSIRQHCRELGISHISSACAQPPKFAPKSYEGQHKCALAVDGRSCMTVACVLARSKYGYMCRQPKRSSTKRTSRRICRHTTLKVLQTFASLGVGLQASLWVPSLQTRGSRYALWARSQSSPTTTAYGWTSSAAWGLSISWTTSGTRLSAISQMRRCAVTCTCQEHARARSER